MNYKINISLALVSFIIMPSIIASGEPKPPLSPRALLNAYIINPTQEMAQQHAGDLLAATVEQDASPALLYALKQQGAHANAIDRRGLPAFIVLADARRNQKLIEQEKQSIPERFRIQLAIAQASWSDSAYDTLDKRNQRIDIQQEINRQLSLLPSTARKHSFNTYIPHLLNIGCSLETKAQGSNAYNGKTCREVLVTDPDFSSMLKAQSSHAVAAQPLPVEQSHHTRSPDEKK